jgi:hypothetical protein
MDVVRNQHDVRVAVQHPERDARRPLFGRSRRIERLTSLRYAVTAHPLTGRLSMPKQPNRRAIWLLLFGILVGDGRQDDELSEPRTGPLRTRLMRPDRAFRASDYPTKNGNFSGVFDDTCLGTGFFGSVSAEN